MRWLRWVISSGSTLFSTRHSSWSAMIKRFEFTKVARPRGYQTWVHSQTQNKAQWLAACRQVSASSQSLRFILSLRLYPSFFLTSRPGYGRNKWGKGNWDRKKTPTINMTWQSQTISWYQEASILLNPLYTNGFFLLVWYNKLGIVYCTYLGVSGYNVFFKILHSFVTFTNSAGPDEMQHYAAFNQGLHCL